jgi:hypothetical protein
MHLADALIGATAIVNMATLITTDAKHFGAIEGLDIESFEPRCNCAATGLREIKTCTHALVVCAPRAKTSTWHFHRAEALSSHRTARAIAAMTK